jgi:hypothetical protein
MIHSLRTLFVLAFLLKLACAQAAPRVVHVLVALCDNVHQGIVPVPKTLGNGSDPASNLYWGSAFGVKTFFNKSTEWKRCGAVAAPYAYILERVVWKHATEDVYLVADAYDGAHIEQTVKQLLRFAGGNGPEEQRVDGVRIPCGGAADLVVYVGHDGLMDFAVPTMEASVAKGKPVIVLACISRRYFAAPLTSAGSHPLLWTTGLMAPEAYTLKAALDGWVAGETDAQVSERAAQAYAKYQKCSVSAARRLLVAGP